MYRQECEQIIKKLMALWPDWRPADEEVVEWQRKLSQYDFNFAAQAISEVFHSQERRLKKPVSKVITDKIAEVAHRKQRDENGNYLSDKPVLAYSVRCVNHSDERYIDRMYDFYAPTGRQLGTQQQRENRAVKVAQGYKGLYGGDWAVVLD